MKNQKSNPIQIGKSLTKLQLVFILFLGLLAACQSSSSGSGEGPIYLEFRLPETLSQNPVRLENFLRNSEFLKIEVKGAHGKLAEGTYGPSQWRDIVAPGPSLSSDTPDLYYHVEIWDREDGVRRAIPVLVGDKHVSWEKVGEERRVQIPLKLQVSPKNFD